MFFLIVRNDHVHLQYPIIRQCWLASNLVIFCDANINVLWRNDVKKNHLRESSLTVCMGFALA